MSEEVRLAAKTAVDVTKASSFTPSIAQRNAKAVLKDNLERALLVKDVSQLSCEELDKLAGCRTGSMSRWMRENEQFYSWLMDTNNTPRKLRVHGEMALDRIQDMLSLPLGDGKRGESITPKDLIKLAELSATLADLFPATKREIKYKDEGVEQIMEHLTEEQIEEQLRLHASARKGKKALPGVVDAEEEGGGEEGP